MPPLKVLPVPQLSSRQCAWGQNYCSKDGDSQASQRHQQKAEGEDSGQQHPASGHRIPRHGVLSPGGDKLPPCKRSLLSNWTHWLLSIAVSRYRQQQQLTRDACLTQRMLSLREGGGGDGTSQSAEWGLQCVPIVSVVTEQVAKPGFSPQGSPVVT